MRYKRAQLCQWLDNFKGQSACSRSPKTFISKPGTVHDMAGALYAIENSWEYKC